MFASIQTVVPTDFAEIPIEGPLTLPDLPLRDLSKKSSQFKKKRLIDAVKGLTKEEHIEIFKIFLNNNENYSENNNGIFINLNTIKESIIEDILKLI